MKLIGLIFITFYLQFSHSDEQSEDEDLNQDCILRFLQISGKIEDDFPSKSVPSNLCRILLPLIYANHSEKLCVRLWETKTIKAECVIENLIKFDYVELELKFEIYEKMKHMTESDKKKKLETLMGMQREALTKAAKICKSDETYGGIFDEILGIESSLAVKQKDFCHLKYVTNQNFLSLRNVNFNPHRIDTSRLRCSEILFQSQEDAERNLVKAFKAREYSADAIECLIDKYRDERIFGWNLAKDLLGKIQINEYVRRKEDIKISKILSNFNKISSNCLYSFNWSLFVF